MRKLKVFVGFTFHESPITRTVDVLRSKFDSSFNKNSKLHMSLFAPFYIESNELEKFIYDATDDLENHFYGHPPINAIEYVGMDVLTQKKKHLLYMKALFNDDFVYLQETLHSLASKVAIETKPNIKKSFLVMGRFYDQVSLQTGIDTLKHDLALPFELPLKSVSLFVKNQYGEWKERNELISFDSSQSSLYQALQYSL